MLARAHLEYSVNPLVKKTSHKRRADQEAGARLPGVDHPDLGRHQPTISGRNDSLSGYFVATKEDRTVE